VHHDGLGSVRALTDETGTTIVTRGYEAFGTKNVEAGSDPLTYGFAGEPFQPDSMLAYHRARWMDARVGRFAGMDPLLDKEDATQCTKCLHSYAYGSNNPANRTDPSGLDDIGDVGLSDFGSLDATPTISILSVIGGLVTSPTGLNKLDQFAISILTPLDVVSTNEGREYGGYITLNSNYTYDKTGPFVGGPRSVTFPKPSDANYVALYHTHAACWPTFDNENFSPDDIHQATSDGVPSYLATPSFAIKKFDPSAKETTTLVWASRQCSN
jgi:RHS repeat-associated protein